MKFWTKLVAIWLRFLFLSVLWNGVVTFNPHYSCSSRADGLCKKCDGVPHCFDLSDEIGCPNNTLHHVPVKQKIGQIHIEAVKRASRKCTDNNCFARFPGPPPLPPFSLCKHVHATETTGKNTEMTTITTGKMSEPPTLTTEKTPESSTLTSGTTQPIVTSSERPLSTTNQTTETVSNSTQTLLPVTTHKQPISMSTFTTSSTSTSTETMTTTTASTTLRRRFTTQVPVFTTIQWLPTTSPKPAPVFMEVWWSCSTVYYRTEDTIMCVNRYYWCLQNKNCLHLARASHSTHTSSSNPGKSNNMNRNNVKANYKSTPTILNVGPSSGNNIHKHTQQMSHTTQTSVISTQRRNKMILSTRKAFIQNRRKQAWPPGPERERKQQARQTSGFANMAGNVIFPSNQQHDTNRKSVNNNIVNKPSFLRQGTTRPPTLNQWYMTTMSPLSATVATPNVFEPSFMSNSDLMYALMILQQF